MKPKPKYGCPVRATVDVLSGKWKVSILWHLSFGSRRFAEIRDLLPGVSEKVLTAQLRDLEANRVVKRTVSPSVPPRVDYALTGSGMKLIPMLEALCEWGSKQFDITPTFPRRTRNHESVQ